jgi:hypothetical protein
MNRDQRSAPRYFLDEPLPALLDGLSADVVDISVKGARVQLKAPVPKGASVSFTINAGGGSLVISATVLWCDLGAFSLSDDESDRYLCGVAFEHPVSMVGHLIEDLVANDAATVIEECRNNERYRVTAQLTASFAGLSGARVLDLSIRGARLTLPAQLKMGTTATLRFHFNGRETPVDLNATIVWSRAAERKGRYEAGLRIDGDEDWLRTVIDELTLRNGVEMERDSLDRKFDPFALRPVAGVLALSR